MEAPGILDSPYCDGVFRVAKFRAQFRAKYCPGIVLDTGAHAVLLSAYLLGIAKIFVERTICRVHVDHPVVGRRWLFSELLFQDFHFHSRTGSVAFRSH